MLSVKRWTMQQVEQQAPDARSIAAARRLARRGPWSEAGSTEALVWGKCQGSGATPYQVSIELTGPAFTCTCPSRKFPCKHGLALLMLWVGGEGSVAEADAPARFAADWAAERVERVGRSSARSGNGPADPEARALRLDRRIERMSSGLAELERWLDDLVTGGMAAAREQPYRWWDQAAARLVDAQLPGLADRVRAMAGAVHAEADWATHLLLEVGRWHLATQAWHRRDELSEAELADLRAYLGWARPSDEIDDRVGGRWQVVGVHRTDDGRLQAQRTWLTDLDSGRTVLALDFATVGGALRVAQVVGTVIAGELGCYPGGAPNRVRVPDGIDASARRADLPATGSIDDALAARSVQVEANPWLDRSPAALGKVVVLAGATGATARVVDASGASLPVTADTELWPLLATTGPDPVAMFAEVDDGGIRPLTVATGCGLVPL
jgi:hypothetical protein